MWNWLVEKVGLNNVQWINRAFGAAAVAMAAKVCWNIGRADGIIEATNIAEKSLNSK